MRRWLILPAMLLPFLLWYDGNFRIRVRTTDFPHPKVCNEVRIVHIGDLRGLNWGNGNRIIVEQIAQLQPDLICITGIMHAPDDTIGRSIAETLIDSLRSIAPTLIESPQLRETLCIGHTRLHISSDVSAHPSDFGLLLCGSPSPTTIAQADYDLLLCNICPYSSPNVLVTAGLGNASDRLFHPPEIHLVTLKPPSK